VKQVIAVVAKHNLTLETGHSSAEEGLMIIREARSQGVQHIVVTHATRPPVRMSIAQMQQAAKMGAYIEFVYDRMNMAENAKAIRAVGPASCILSSDLGQKNNPLHPDGLAAFFASLKKEGLSQAEIDQMSKTNPAKALGLD
jgi:predicted metal-dependent phosphotriesterase family hydrolase